MEGGESSNAGGDNAGRKYPIGFRFKPTDVELVEYYLLPKLQGKPTVSNDAIIEADVYAYDPEILIELYRDRGETQWHFLSRRTRKYQHGDRPSRRTADDCGRWKPSTGKSQKEKELEEENSIEPDGEKVCSNGAVKFCVTTLAYHVGPPKDERKTKWLMHEITIPEYEIKVNSGDPGRSTTLDRYAMCTIYISPLTKWHKDKNEATSTALEAAGSSSKTMEPAPEIDEGTAAADQELAAPTTLSSKLAGKRPAVEQPPPGHTPAGKRARQATRARGRPPAPMHNINTGGAIGVPLGAAGPTGAYYTVPRQQMPTIPWPPVTSNRLQGPVQLSQPRMYTHMGRAVAAGPYGRQALAVQELAGSSLRLPVSGLGHNALHRTMVMRPPTAPGFEQKMVMRPPPPASFEQKLMMHPQNGLNLAAGQTLLPRPAPQPRQNMQEVDMNDPYTQQVISQFLASLREQESDAAQQQGSTASYLLPPQQQPMFDAGASHPARANGAVPHPARGGQQHHRQQQQIPVTNVSFSGGAAAPASDNASSKLLPVRGDADGGSGNGEPDSNADQDFADLASCPWMGR